MTALDYLAIAAYAGVVLLIGLRSARGHDSADDLQLGKRSLPTWAVLLSLVATELSAATFIGVPHASYTGDWSYIQLAFGALCGKLLLAWRVIPLYHRMGVITVYGYLEQRFGPTARRVAALCFVAGRVLASGVRLFIAALAFSSVTGWSVETAIVAAGLIAGVYTRAGGIRAVIWTDTFQAAVFLISALSVVAVLAAQMPGGISGILDWAEQAERSRVFHFDPLFSLSQSRPFLVGVIGGFFLTLATHATDHDMVQRLLSTRNGRSGAQALAWSALINFPMSLLFLFIGTSLALFYSQAPGYEIADARQIVPIFALHELPTGLRGLLFAGLFAAAMSSLDSAVCAIATTWVVDVDRRAASESELARRTRAASVGFCLMLTVAAVGMAAYQRAISGAEGGLNLVEFALSAMTILYGGLLGVFGLGFVWRQRGNDASAVAGLAAGSFVGLCLFLHPIVLGKVWLAWTFWVPLGAATAFGVAALARARRPAL
ncbi:MAG: sodium/solute symporter [bacterium]|nr:sodium/solute symporter [bacterium]